YGTLFERELDTLFSQMETGTATPSWWNGDPREDVDRSRVRRLLARLFRRDTQAPRFDLNELLADASRIHGPQHADRPEIALSEVILERLGSRRTGSVEVIRIAAPAPDTAQSRSPLGLPGPSTELDP